MNPNYLVESMSEQKRTTIIHQIAIDTDERPDLPSTPQVLIENVSRRNSTRNSNNWGGSKRQSQKANNKTDETIESITLQESAPKNHPLPLKASFLRRKAKEYEGKFSAK